jgi:integrase
VSDRPRRERTGKPDEVARVRAPKYDRRRKQWRSKYVDVDGVVRQCGMFRTKGDARARAVEVVAERNAAAAAEVAERAQAETEERPAPASDQSQYTVAGWFEVWPDEFPMQDRTRRTNVNRVKQVLPHLPDNGEFPLEDLTRRMLREAQGKLLQAGLAKRTVDHDMSAMSVMLRDAREAELVEDNVAIGLTVKVNDPRLRPKRKQKPRRVVPTDEVRALADELPLRYRAIPWTPLLTGGRPEEILAYNRNYFDWAPPDEDDGDPFAAGTPETIYVHEHVERYGRCLPGTKTKLYIPEVELRGRVTLFPRVLRAMIDESEITPDGYLYPSPAGLFWGRRNWYNRFWIPARRRAGVSVFDLYDLRHTFASRLAAAGVPEPDISGWMGHAIPPDAHRGTARRRISTTRLVYIHPTYESKQHALNTLTRLVIPTYKGPGESDAGAEPSAEAA